MLIIGGGVVGISLAWELAQHGAKVCVVDRGNMGREASWAGVGMVPPGPARSCWDSATTLEKMAGLSSKLHFEWSQSLLDQTGVDNEYRRCGTIRLALSQVDSEALRQQKDRWNELGIECHQLDAAQLADVEPGLADRSSQFTMACLLPAEAQIRNPCQLKALLAACRQKGVELRPGTEVHEFRKQDNQVSNAVTDDGKLIAGQYCLTAGCWSGQLAESLGLALPVRPVRGQIFLLKGEQTLLNRNIYVGLKYLTPRRDGRVLVGSTMEEAGFIKENTPEAREELLRFATDLVPSLAKLPVETCWSGLRPGTTDGKPFLGRAGSLENAWVSTGHFRAGLQLSSASAVIMRSLLLGQTSPIDVTSLGVDR